MDNEEQFIKVLKNGVVPATGCTEPIAVAYGAAVCKKYLPNQNVEKIEVKVSMNILKNALAVVVPGTGESGLNVAAAAGALIGEPDEKLKVISGIKTKDLPEILKLANSKDVTVDLAKVEDDLYVDVKVISDKNSAEVWIAGSHTNVFRIEHNQQLVFGKNRPAAHAVSEYKIFLRQQNFNEIWNFATNVSLEKIEFMKQAANLNLALTREGLDHSYGLKLGQALVNNTDDLENQILTYTVAASDARMGGATLPAMSNSGSGNQGITATMPVWVVAQNQKASEEKLIRALTLSHLTALYIHSFLPVLSAFCAADSAAMGASAGVSYLMTDDYQTACRAIKNMTADSIGMVCDGAGCSCAMKVASSVSSMYRSTTLAMKGVVVPATNGIVCDDIDQTIRKLGAFGSKGLKETDPVVLDLMMNK